MMKIDRQSDGMEDDDVVIFTGSGSTAAVLKIVSALSLDKTARTGNLFKGRR